MVGISFLKGVCCQAHIGFGGVVVFGYYGRSVNHRFLEAISTHGTLSWVSTVACFGWLGFSV